MKKNLFVTIYAVFVSLIFAGTIVFSGISLYSKNSKGYIESKKTFDSMTMELKQAFQNPTSPNMNEKINHAIGSYDKYSFISIKVNGNTVFLYPGDTDQPSENTKFSKLYFTTVKAGDLNVYIQANVYTLSPSSISYVAKVSFIIVLIFTLLTIVLIFVIASGEQDSEVIEETYEDETDGDEPETEVPDPVKIEAETAVKEDPEVSSEENKTTEFEDFPADEIAITPEEGFETEEAPEETVEEKIESEKEAEEEEEDAEPEEPAGSEAEEKAKLPVEDYKPSVTAPNGLYSPVTGFGWESYLKPRLENELSRASASEFDVVLFLIKITDFESYDEEKIHKLCDYLTNVFQFKDLIFEYKTNCFAAIKTNTTIDEAIPVADQIYTEIGEEGKCFIGMSSKTIRIVGAERILKEADAALDHAMEDPESPIIAFRVNAEKYMDFIENN